MNFLFTAFASELVKTGASVARSILTPQSSNVRGYSYDPTSQALTITYKSGGTYRYDGVPKNTARSLGRAKSVGKAVNRLIKAPGYAYEKVAWHQHECGSCGEIWGHEENMFGDETAHRCGSCGDIQWVIKMSMADIGAIAAATRGMPLGTRKGRRPPKPKGHLATKQASSILEYFDKSRRSIMKLAGVAKKQITWGGLRMKIEYEPGDIRTGKSKEGKTWERKMYASYGYIPGTKGVAADGDAIDIYLAPEPVDGAPVFEIRQERKEGGYDESKFMVGWSTAEAAKKAYLQHMPAWAFGSMKEVAGNARDFAASLHAMPKAAGVAEYGMMPALAMLQSGSPSAPTKPAAPKPTAPPAPKTTPPPKPSGPVSTSPASGVGGSAATGDAMKKTSMPMFLGGFLDELVKVADVVQIIKQADPQQPAKKKTIIPYSPGISERQARDQPQASPPKTKKTIIPQSAFKAPPGPTKGIEGVDPQKVDPKIHLPEPPSPKGGQQNRFYGGGQYQIPPDYEDHPEGTVDPEDEPRVHKRPTTPAKGPSKGTVIPWKAFPPQWTAKSAGIRDFVARFVRNRPAPRLGFFQRRALAKAWGIKPSEVEQRILENQRRARRLGAGTALGGLALGTMAGSELS